MHFAGPACMRSPLQDLNINEPCCRLLRRLSSGVGTPDNVGLSSAQVSDTVQNCSNWLRYSAVAYLRVSLAHSGQTCMAHWQRRKNS